MVSRIAVCPICGKEYKDLEGLPGKKRLQKHINAVHGKVVGLQKFPRRKAEKKCNHCIHRWFSVDGAVCSYGKHPNTCGKLYERRKV